MCRDYFLGKLTAFEDKDAFMAIESNLNTELSTFYDSNIFA